ncbi:MAG: nucleoside monophosphate kinase [Christensenellales bacterium]
MNLILLGAPGAGKGTQAVRIAEKYSVPHISTGDIFRKNIKEQTPIGVIAKSYIDRGELVPDEVTVEIVRLRLAEPTAKTVICSTVSSQYRAGGSARQDRRRRKGNQYRRRSRRSSTDFAADAFAANAAKVITCPQKGRQVRQCGSDLIHRDDDKPETVNSRLDVYVRSTAPLIDYYSKQGKLVSVNGMKKIEEVFEEISEALDKR